MKHISQKSSSTRFLFLKKYKLLESFGKKRIFVVTRNFWLYLIMKVQNDESFYLENKKSHESSDLENCLLRSHESNLLK